MGVCTYTTAVWTDWLSPYLDGGASEKITVKIYDDVLFAIFRDPAIYFLIAMRSHINQNIGFVDVTPIKGRAAATECPANDV